MPKIATTGKSGALYDHIANESEEKVWLGRVPSYLWPMGCEIRQSYHPPLTRSAKGELALQTELSWWGVCYLGQQHYQASKAHSFGGNVTYI